MFSLFINLLFMQNSLLLIAILLLKEVTEKKIYRKNYKYGQVCTYLYFFTKKNTKRSKRRDNTYIQNNTDKHMSLITIKNSLSQTFSLNNYTYVHQPFHR